MDFLCEMNNHIDRILAETHNLDPIFKWVYLKDQIALKSQEYAKRKSKENDLIISQLSEKTLELQFDVSKEYSEQKQCLLEKTKADMEKLIAQKTRGTMFRAKVRWYEHGEKSTKYFYNLEKRRYQSRVCGRSLQENGTEIMNFDKILQLQEDYYRSLFKSNDQVCFNLTNTYGIKVEENSGAKQEEPFSKTEIAEALMKLKSNKMPGLDGLSPEFYKVFYAKIGDSLYNMINTAYDDKLPEEILTGIINLIPKQHRDIRILKNLRPLTLLNTDYKIIEKAVSNRIKPSLETLINEDQTGFMKNRRISVNIRKILDLMQYTEQKNLESYVMSLDFAKCFDKIEFTAILGAMKYFGFSAYLQKWIKYYIAIFMPEYRTMDISQIK